MSERLQYRAIYCKAYENIDSAISQRFDQADFLIYKDLQQVFMNAVQGIPYEEEMRRVCKTYSADVSYGNLVIDNQRKLKLKVVVLFSIKGIPPLLE